MAETSVRIVEYDPAWPDRCAAERDRLLDAVGHRLCRVERVGRTAVEGLAAKPVVDLTATVDDWDRVGECVDPLEALGYEYVPESADVETPWRYFEKRPADGQAFNLHLRPRGSKEVEENLLFRDHLREHPHLARRYAVLKRRAAVEYPDDLRAYSEAKTAFVEAVLDAARAARD